MKKAAFLIMVINILSKTLGFLREIVQSYLFGASAVTDAYLISQTIPTMIFGFISAGIATGFIPMYSRILTEEGSALANRFTNNLSNALLLLASVTVGIVLVFTKPIVKLFAAGFGGETLRLTITFTRISVFGVYFSALLSIFSEFLRLHKNYIVPALIGFPMNFFTIAAFFLSAKTSIYVLIIGSVVATASQLLLLIPFVRKVGYKYEAALNLKDRYMKEMLLIALPVIIGTSVRRINTLVDRTLASSLAVGGISALNYASRLNGFIQGLFVASITTVLYPTISKMAAAQKVKDLKTAISEAIGIINLLVIPATVGALIFSEEIVILLFGRGAFTPEAVEMTASALFFYSVGMIAFGLRDVLSRAFYAFQDTKTPMINASIAVVMNIVLNIILSRFLGIGGLALATSISVTVSALLMFITLRKKIGPFGLAEITRSFIKISLASVLMGALAFGSFKISGRFLTQNLALILSIGIGALTYAVIIYFMKIPEVDNTLAALKKRIGARIQERNNKEQP